jgi:hypothetical protein
MRPTLTNRQLRKRLLEMTDAATLAAVAQLVLVLAVEDEKRKKHNLHLEQ